jgi:hypothetical protein
MLAPSRRHSLTSDSSVGSEQRPPPPTTACAPGLRQRVAQTSDAADQRNPSVNARGPKPSCSSARTGPRSQVGGWLAARPCSASTSAAEPTTTDAPLQHAAAVADGYQHVDGHARIQT